MTGAVGAVRTALIAALRGDPALAGRLNGVFAVPPVRASPPYAEIAEIASSDWGTKDAVGRELAVPVILRAAGETSVAITTLAHAVEGAVDRLPRDLPGWRVASAVFVRSRIAGEAPGRWIAAVEFRVRMLATAQA